MPHRMVFCVMVTLRGESPPRMSHTDAGHLYNDDTSSTFTGITKCSIFIPFRFIQCYTDFLFDLSKFRFMWINVSEIQKFCGGKSSTSKANSIRYPNPAAFR